MSRKIDRVNDLTVLSGDGEKVLVGGELGKMGGEITGKSWGNGRKKLGF